ncbi:nitroreductase family protein [Nocardioides terrae]|uniref:nitroreductase family protein n=1 Tax=Nocardioides terrae TaxID=574651 RepID=UPI001C317E6D|nr:nitroreductase family protein [Nocardioides terrae]
MSVDLHPLLRGRFSPLRFDSAHVLAGADVELLLEAARWAPSAGNSQPWAFLVARRGEPDHDTFVRRLAPSSRRWAPDASALLVNLAHRTVDDSRLPYSEFADYDLGQAVAHLTLQASAMGLSCRQFRVRRGRAERGPAGRAGLGGGDYDRGGHRRGRRTPRAGATQPHRPDDRAPREPGLRNVRRARAATPGDRLRKIVTRNQRMEL